MKTITIKLKKAGSKTSYWDIEDNLGNVLAKNVHKDILISGISFNISDEASVIKLIQTGKKCCKNNIKYIPVQVLTENEVRNLPKFEVKNTASMWSHLTNSTLFNSFYGCIHPYILEHPFAYQFNDEIIQDVKDYSKVYTYLLGEDYAINNRRIQNYDGYFNKAVVYNDQQSSGILSLHKKPVGNMKLYMSYPKYKEDNKEILYTHNDNFYQFNTFWNIVKDNTKELFSNTCETLSIDREVNQSNMDYSNKKTKDKIRGKDCKIRLILDNRDDLHIVSHVITHSSQISYK